MLTATERRSSRTGLVDLEAIRAASLIEVVVAEHVALRRAGVQLVGLCLFHEERTPSFAVHPGKQVFHCYGCGAGGDVFDFIKRRLNCDFLEAASYLAARAGINTETLTAEQRAQTAAAEAQRRKARADADLFDEWRNTCHRILADDFYELGQMAERAKRVLVRFPDCEPAWSALAAFYHREAELSAALDVLSFEKCSPWLLVPMMPEKLATAFHEASAALGEDF